MKKKKFIKVTLLILVPLITILAIASILSYSYFGVANPIASGVGLIKVKMFDTTFVEVQKSPKVIFLKTDYGIVKAMEEHGYTFLEEEQMGSMLTFEKNGAKFRGIGNGGIISFFRAE